MRGADVVISLEQRADLQIVQLMPLPPHYLLLTRSVKISIGLTCLVPAYPGCREKETVKRVSV